MKTIETKIAKNGTLITKVSDCKETSRKFSDAVRAIREMSETNSEITIIAQRNDGSFICDIYNGSFDYDESNYIFTAKNGDEFSFWNVESAIKEFARGTFGEAVQVRRFYYRETREFIKANEASYNCVYSDLVKKVDVNPSEYAITPEAMDIATNAEIELANKETKTAVAELVITTKNRSDGTPVAYYVNGKKLRKSKIEFYYAKNPAYRGLIEIDYSVARYYLPDIYNNKSKVIFKNWADAGLTVVTKAAADELGLRIGTPISLRPAIYRIEEATEADPSEYAITPEAMDVAIDAETELANAEVWEEIFGRRDNLVENTFAEYATKTGATLDENGFCARVFILFDGVWVFNYKKTYATCNDAVNAVKFFKANFSHKAGGEFKNGYVCIDLDKECKVIPFKRQIYYYKIDDKGEEIFTENYFAEIRPAEVDPAEYATTPEAMEIAINAEIELANAANVKAIKEQIAHIKSDIHYREGALKDLEENHLAKYPDDESLKELRAEWVNELSDLKAQLANLENGEAKEVAEAKEAVKERDTEFEKVMTEVRFFAHCADVKSLKKQIASTEREIAFEVHSINYDVKDYLRGNPNDDASEEGINASGAALVGSLNKLAELKAQLANLAPYEIDDEKADAEKFAVAKLVITTEKHTDGTIIAYYVNGEETSKASIDFYCANNTNYNGVIEIDADTAKYNFPYLYNHGRKVIFKNWGTSFTTATKSAADELGLNIGKQMSISPVVYLVDENAKATTSEDAIKEKTQVKEKSPMIITIDREAEKMTVSAGTGKAKAKKYFVDGEKMTRGQTEIVIRSYVQSAIETGATIEIDNRLANEFDAIAKTPYKGEVNLVYVDENGKPVKDDAEKKGMFADEVDTTPHNVKITMFGDKTPIFKIMIDGRNLTSKRGGHSLSQKEVDEWIIKAYQQRKQYPNMKIEVPRVVASLYLDSFASNPRIIRELNVALTNSEEKNADHAEYAITPEAMEIAINAEIENATNNIKINERIQAREAQEHIENVYHDLINFIRLQKIENGLTQEQCEFIYSTIYAKYNFGSVDFKELEKKFEELDKLIEYYKTVDTVKICGTKKDTDGDSNENGIEVKLTRLYNNKNMLTKAEFDKMEKKLLAKLNGDSDYQSKLAELQNEYNAATIEHEKAVDAVKAAEKALQAARELEQIAAGKRIKAGNAIYHFGSAKAAELHEKILSIEITKRPSMIITNQFNCRLNIYLETIFIAFYEYKFSIIADTDYGTCTLGEYDTPAQVERVIKMLKAAVARGDKDFIFPTVEELSGINEKAARRKTG